MYDEKGHPVRDLLSPDLWQQNRWGLANPAQDRVLKLLLSGVDSPQKRRQIALDHQAKALRRAKQFMAAMDIPAKPPATLHYFLVAGDSEDTKKTVQFDANGQLSVVEKGPGDGTVLRQSALMDERRSDDPLGRLKSPIHWSQVLFLFSDHLDLTKDPAFTDNLLYFLLESPRSS